jgi:SAM-dependent methyltransferase
VQHLSLLEVGGAFEAGLAVLSLHHVEPLEESCAHLATLIAPGGRLVIDELDVERYDERAARWWLAQRHALGLSDHDADASKMVRDLREHVHSLPTVCAALRPYFEVGVPTPCAYLHRWELRPSLREVEVESIADGRLPATGARFVAVRRA